MVASSYDLGARLDCFIANVHSWKTLPTYPS